MARFPKHTAMQVDLFKTEGIFPVGAVIKDGVLSPAWSGVADASSYAVNNFCAMRYFVPEKRILAGSSDGKIYSGTSAENLTVIHTDGGATPFVLEMSDTEVSRALLISGHTFTTIHSGGLLHGYFSVELSCGVVRCGRIFGADANSPYTLRWSGTNGYLDWVESVSGAGSLILDPEGGAIIGLFDFEDSLVIFRENCIMRYSTYGIPENFKKISSIMLPPIYRKSAAITGDSILFATQVGLMRYKGGKVEKLEGLITGDMISCGASLVYDGRYYFLCGESKTPLYNSVIYVYDFIEDAYQLINVPAYILTFDGQSPFAFVPHGTARLKYDSGGPQYNVTTGTVDFGTKRAKMATFLDVDCDENVIVIIHNGRTRFRIYNIYGKKRINIRGKKFYANFQSRTGKVRKAVLTAEVLDDF